MNSSRKVLVADLLDGCRRGDSKTQELLYKVLSNKMLGVCARYARNSYEAEEMLQLGFIKVFRKINDFREEGSFEGWIRRVMVNTAIEVYRKEQKSLGLVDLSDVHDAPQQMFAMDSLEVKDLLAMVQELSVGYRLVFNLYAIEGYSHKEIAQQLGITEGASKSQLSRARAVLREKLSRMEAKKYESNVR
ncbi:RNA polymerase sigma-70 factor (ECF subfamily) [Arcticibacter pallidicorallinus]|uniref:RNA polymerase sigma-70 factor (ECF subfamily) n=1 Tax=Arcticibacter pallidicorallinus TaxID=1259464 RepID=A0A2T0UAV2_9SPHI|nr:sigma-70 family RNA polymerase sigma factor [Arcticibacter pallidicorallinus]PRY55061.1 RNA polymerase sigma-70 factor (ECF subfamily) [Arcticibacter pallidicorallinus]